MKLQRYSREDIRLVPMRDGSVLAIWRRTESEREALARLLAQPYDARDPYAREVGGES